MVSPHKSALALVGTTLRVYARAPVFFTLLTLLLFPSTYILEATLPESVSDYLDFLVTEVIVALVQAPILARTAELLRGAPPPGWAAMARLAAAVALPMLVVTWLQLLTALFGLILFIVPGLILLAMYFVAGPMLIAERTGPVESLQRSAVLTADARWRIVGAILILGLPFMVAVGLAYALGIADKPAGHIADAATSIISVLSTILAGVVYQDIRRDQDQSQIADVFV